MQKVIFVLFLLGVFMAGSFFVPPETLNDRFQIALTLLLSTVHSCSFTSAYSIPYADPSCCLRRWHSTL